MKRVQRIKLKKIIEVDFICMLDILDSFLCVFENNKLKLDGCKN